MGAFERVELLIGKENLKKLSETTVAIFGVGGVGGYVVEALARCGVGKITLFDNDVIAESNLNRQIIARVDDLGKDKVSVMKERILSINPNAQVVCNKVFYLPENADDYPLDEYDYIVDAIDTVSAKIEIIVRAKKGNIPVISCMGTGGKLDPSKLKVTDISKTKICPLARVMRRELKARNVNSLKVVYSEEERINFENNTDRKVIPSMIFVPASAGLMIASEVVKELING